jgi:arylsulfatase A-like enzyme
MLQTEGKKRSVLRDIATLLCAMATAGALACSSVESATAQPVSKRQNIMLILADDLGYSDIAPFGGEIDTPNLTALAKSGVRMTNFYASPACSPTRSMLLSGTDNHIAGLGNMAELVAPQQKGRRGYEGFLNNDVAALPELLRDGGYHTYMVGKWHLGLTEELSPAARGFEQSYAMMQGGAGFFDQTGNAPAPDGGKSKSIYRENGKLASLPEYPGFYSTDFYTDKAIEYIKSNRSDGRPFFAYVAYTAPHFPLQAPDKLIEKYKDRYTGGYEAIANERLTRMKEMGLVPSSVGAQPKLPVWPSWTTLTPEQRASEARRMAVYAAMVDSMDQNIGKLISYLREINELENTVVVFLSDNGAEGSDINDLVGSEWVKRNFNNAVENIGRPGSYVGYGPGWGRVGATPFRLYKGYTAEGGVRSPTIITQPRLPRQGQIDTHVASIKDLAPTFLQIAGVAPPKGEFKGRKVAPIQGTSLWPFLNGEVGEPHPSNYSLAMELFGRVFVRKGNWKLIWVNKPWGESAWELFDLSNDPGEHKNVASQHPDKLNELLNEWKQYQKENGVVFDEGISSSMKYSNGQDYYHALEQ